MEKLVINGWLHADEMLALRRWCFQKDVLELGVFEGASSCCIATTAKTLLCVDTFDARGTAEAGKQTEEAFWRNINAIERNAKVTAIKGTFADVLPTLTQKFDIIFIDGSHDYLSVKEDIELCLPLLKEGGRILFHDYCTENPGVVMAVDEFQAGGAIPCGQANSLVMFSVDPLPAEAPTAPKIVIGMPHRDGWACYGSARALAATPSQKYTRWIIDQGNSILTLTFNTLFAQALNLRDREGATHFAMLHNDVVPLEPNWVDVLMQEMEEHDLDMISAVVPIKNEKGLTSTATDHLGYPWGVRRLTMTEVMDLPETFTIKDVPHREPGACLLLNTGCWLMRITDPWVAGLLFRQQDRIVWCLSENGWVAQSISEDWDFSRQMVARGCRIGATRKVKLFHQLPQYHNESAWGTQRADEDFLSAERETEHLKSQEVLDYSEADELAVA